VDYTSFITSPKKIPISTGKIPGTGASGEKVENSSDEINLFNQFTKQLSKVVPEVVFFVNRIGGSGTALALTSIAITIIPPTSRSGTFR